MTSVTHCRTGKTADEGSSSTHIDLFLVSSYTERSTIDLDLYMYVTVLQTQHYV